MKNIALSLSLLAAFAGGILVGYADLTADEVQGPALLLMIVAFLCAFPRRAPGWLIAIVAMLGLPLVHAIANSAHMQGGPPTAGMLIALIPAMIGAYAGVAMRMMVSVMTRE